jgi:DNA-binding LacI/PurR family transcriptional regulator
MGRLAAEIALKRIGDETRGEHPAVRFVDPELVIRESTGAASPPYPGHAKDF